MLELMVAVLLLGMIATMIYSILNVGIKYAERGTTTILTMARRYSFLGLLNEQISNAFYDAKEKRLMISSDGPVFRIVTRRPYLYRTVGVVLAVYRYNPSDKTLYYQEKRDYYNPDYDDKYVPDFGAMVVLARDEPSFNVEYDQATGDGVTVSYQGAEYVFYPRCINEESTPKL